MDLTYESTQSILLVEEASRKTNGCGSSNDTSLVACSRFKERDDGGEDQDHYKSRGKNKANIGIVERKVIWEENCKFNPKANPQASNSSRANITEEENSYEYAKVLSIVQQGSIKDQWILDSGASFHMTPYGDWFYTYQSYNGDNN